MATHAVYGGAWIAVVDSLTPERRSEVMSRIRSTDTKPEMRVRRLAYALGFRYRLHRKDLPGKPDLVFIGRRKVIFVHGCFWHLHAGCPAGRIPKSRTEFWEEKLKRNQQRDETTMRELVAKGWRVLVLWECQLKDEKALAGEIFRFLDTPSR